MPKPDKEIENINNLCRVYNLVEEFSWGHPVTIYPANTDNCKVSFDFEKGQFIFDNNKYVVKYHFSYNFDSNRYDYDNNYYYTFEDGRLLWYEDSNNYEYYEKE